MDRILVGGEMGKSWGRFLKQKEWREPMLQLGQTRGIFVEFPSGAICREEGKTSEVGRCQESTKWVYKEHSSSSSEVARSCLTLATPWTRARQGPLSMGFSRQEYWRGLHFLLQGIFLTQGSKPGLLHCRQILYPGSYEGSPIKNIGTNKMVRHLVKSNLKTQKAFLHGLTKVSHLSSLFLSSF